MYQELANVLFNLGTTGSMLIQDVELEELIETDLKTALTADCKRRIIDEMDQLKAFGTSAANENVSRLVLTFYVYV